jgi:formylglycine-generating enzyme required for sulfatase activity
MSKSHKKLSRREFLALVGGATSVTVLGACTSPRASSISIQVVPTATPRPPQPFPTKVEPTPTEIQPTPTPAILVTDSGLEMVLVEAGSFQMGSADGKPGEQPVHTVNITRPFYASKYEVTFEQYDEFCDDTTRRKLDDDGWGRGNRPATIVVWPDAVEYCNWLSEKEGLTPCYSGQGTATKCDFSANGYRLPTEAEWEYAARGGYRSQGFMYPGSDNVDDVGWHVGNSGTRTRPVGQKQPNELGLYDMGGNVWEFCWDWYDRNYYESSPTDDPLGPSLPSDPFERNRTKRGGCCSESSDSLRTTYRSWSLWYHPTDNDGFRIVRTAR